MTTGVELWVGALAPEAYVLELTSADADIDLSTVTAAVLHVQAPDGTESTWDAVHVWDAVEEVLTLTHVFHATTSELDKSGPWSAYAWLTTPDGPIRSRPRRIIVWPRYAVRP